MEIVFSSEEIEVQRTVRQFVRRKLLPVSRQINEEGELPKGVKDHFVSMELLRSPFPERYGGVGGTFTGFIIALRELCYATTIPAWYLLENFLLATSLHRHGSELLRKTYLPSLLSLKTLGALAFTETETGSDPAQLKTVAERMDGGWRINGSKRFITHSGICDQMILFAKTEEGVTAFLVESGKKGYKPGKKESFVHMRGLQNGDVYLEDYFASEDYVIGEMGKGFEILLDTETLGKVAFSSLFVGLAQRALDLSIEYANTRTHRGQPIGKKFQMTQLKLARMAARVEAMNAYLHQVAAQVDGGKDISQEAATLKLLVATDINEVTADAMEIHGAYGLSEEYDIGSLHKEAISAQVVMGSLDIQRVIIAKSLLSRGSCR